MPELPEVQTMADVLASQFSGHWISRAELGSLSALKTYDPPITALADATLLGTGRQGKFLILHLADADGIPLDLVIHLSRAGWMHWRTSKALAPLRPGKGPVALRLTWRDEAGDTTVLDVTEAGTQKRLAVYLVRDLADVPGLQRLGPDALALTEEQLSAILRGAGRRQLKTLLREQSIISGIGNAYSDEILHAAKLSPYAPADTLTEQQVKVLWTALRDVLQDALERARDAKLGHIKSEKRAGLRVHDRTGEPCDVCGTPIAQVRLADSSFQYCPTCQTGGKPLADRRMSRLLK
ncbi:MAG: Fpg/Nei family DNA glycosylase [Actinobacteria bacterium]|jgi:formamidopyrimidine-DNA glycosylase|nr:Fpg/Nei family DNA glycosylase [Actinomycetota bacterium]MCB9429702.1 Fpg/Nei family DNA glycosylase [Actinomycetota bacterium]HPE12502.1 DNA-formamidopyrimidine glycosylase family protein [Actinomycetota bacterium]HPQ82995.1 DNA-formamidopyrimidine glycosylase family protein [Actinomycetota bacterium]HRV66138.1 DNA-formamidopyrimidine glycosylase family protein [Candidatus Nanopelagicales bacterium]